MAKMLELSTTDFDRPIVRIDGEDFEMRVPEELTFSQFGRQITIGKRVIELAEHGVDESGLLELHELIVEAAQLLLINVPNDVARKITPGLYRRIQTFFNELGSADDDEAEASDSASNSPPGASDSMAASGAG